MSIFKKAQVQGSSLVDRDEKGQITKVTTSVMTKSPRANWRKLASDHTNSGMDMLEILINIARGNPRQLHMPDGQVSEWQIPTIEASRQAAKDVFELINGKAVAATEVMKAIKDSEDVSQYAHASEDALLDAARQYLERADKRVLQLESQDESDDSKGS